MDSLKSKKQIRFRLVRFLSSAFMFVLLSSPGWVAAEECRPRPQRRMAATAQLKDAVNPQPLAGDIELPMPCGGRMVLRAVCVPAAGYLEDTRVELGCQDCGRSDQGYMEGKRNTALSAPFTVRDLPAAWRDQISEASRLETGPCPLPPDSESSAHMAYYFIGKYEVTRYQWRVIMEGKCPNPESGLASDEARPQTGLSWYDAVDFTRKYTQWLLKTVPAALPKFADGRAAFLRLPTEAEWEYAARGGHNVSRSQMAGDDSFPLSGKRYSDFAVFTDPRAAKPPERLSWVGSKCPNPMGLFDTAGNAAEMIQDLFHFTVGNRLHGAPGGFVVKGGSFRKRQAETLPGRREELPFFLRDAPFRGTDVGFRVVLSAIVTPRERYAALQKEWDKLQEEKAFALANGTGISGGDGQDIGNGENETDTPLEDEAMLLREIVALERFASGDPSAVPTVPVPREKKPPQSEKAGPNTDPGTETTGGVSPEVLQNQQLSAIDGIIRSALLTAELIQSYAGQQKLILNELDRQGIIKNENMFGTALDESTQKMAALRKTLGLYAKSVENLMQSYIARLYESRDYPVALMAVQLRATAQTVQGDDVFSLRMRKHFELFKKHLILQRRRSAPLTAEDVMDDLVP